MIDRSLKYRRAGRSAELRLFRGEQTVLNTRSLQTAECRFRVGQSRQFDRAPITCGLTRETDVLRCRRHVSKRQDRKAAYDALCWAGGSTARNSMPCRLIVGHIPKWLLQKFILGNVEPHATRAATQLAPRCLRAE